MTLTSRVGENVPPMKKGRYGVVHGSVQGHFAPFHLQMEVNSIDELSDDSIIEKVRINLSLLI